MDFFEILKNQDVRAWLYLSLFLGMFFEATLTLLTACFLVSQGTLSFAPAFFAVLSGAYLEELLWYWIGLNINRFKKISRFTNNAVGILDRHFFEKLFRTLMVSKFVYGLHRAILARAGMLKVPFRQYLKTALWVVLIWMVIIGFFGFAFSASYVLLKHYFKYAEFFILIFVGVIITIEILAAKHLKKTL